MCGGSQPLGPGYGNKIFFPKGPGTPEVPPPPTPPPEPPTPIDPAVKQARADETQRLKAARGRQGTIVTGALGLDQSANTGAQKLSGT